MPVAKPVRDVFSTGVRAVDSMLTLGVGQRLGIFAGAGVGKSVLIKQLIGAEDPKTPLTDSRIADLLGGQVQVTFGPMSTSIGYIRAGKLRALAVGSPKRSANYPEIPTFRELGYDLVATNWFGLAGPARLAGALIVRTVPG